MNFMGINFSEESVNPQIQPTDGVVKGDIFIERLDNYFVKTSTA